FVFLCVCFFFFQAEDGIRDDLVTGVQTCALPILHAGPFGNIAHGCNCLVATSELQPWAMLPKGPACTRAGPPSRVCTRLGRMARSEERRVGKEGRRGGGGREGKGKESGGRQEGRR